MNTFSTVYIHSNRNTVRDAETEKEINSNTDSLSLSLNRYFQKKNEPLIRTNSLVLIATYTTFLV